MADLTPTIEESAAKAKSVVIDGQQIERQSLRELIDADRYLKGAEATRQPHRGIRFNKLSPPGA